MPTIIDGTNGIDKIASGAIEYADLPTGSILQVVQGTTSTGVSNSTGSAVDTGLSASITPKATTSKILVIISQPFQVYGSIGNSWNVWLARNGSNIQNEMIQLGSATSAANYYNMYITLNMTYLDSPATTSATTYKTTFANAWGGGGTLYGSVNPNQSTITLIEVAA
jgi:hypothetical protein